VTIVLYLMNEKGKKTLEKLCQEFYPQIISAVICSRDSKLKNDYYDEIKKICYESEINFLDRSEDRGAYSKDYRIAVGWRWMIPSMKNLIIFHDSLIPKYRGFAPLVNALLNGESEIGVTALFASDRFDQGDVIAQKRLPIEYPIKISDAISKIALLYQELAVTVVHAIQLNSLSGSPQNGLDATYSVWRDEEDYHINWNDSAGNIIRFINALGYPYAGAFSWINDCKVLIKEAVEIDDIKLVHRHVGKVIFVIDGLPIVIANKGLVKLEKLTDVDGRDLLPLKNFRVRFK